MSRRGESRGSRKVRKRKKGEITERQKKRWKGKGWDVDTRQELRRGGE